LGRRLRTPARCLWARLTPGGSFGLEFTTLMAVLAVSLFVLISYAAQINSDPGPTASDRTVLDVAESIRMGWLTTIAKALTHLGSAGVVIPLAAICAAALAAARRWPEFLVLVAGTLIIVVALGDIKDAIDRPRPGGGLISVPGSSFPSGHAAYSVFYLWAAVTLVMRVRPGMARATGVVIAGIALTALVGLSRVYLHVHYMSDVSAGWALGISAYALCAAIALVGFQLRQNGLGAGGSQDRN
jgi:undecaprenyl-diphosphatase